MNDKAKKPSKLRARLPRGLADRGPAELAATRRMTETIRAVYERYGFDPVETPAFEYTDALGKFLPDQDRPNEGVFSFQDDDEQWISLRYDLTAPLARHVAENYQNLPLPYRSYRAGYVFRNEKPGPGRFRQFMQFDADTVGSASPAADAEMCMMAADAMEALGFQRGQYVVKVNSRKIFDGLREIMGISEDSRWLTVMRAIDKLDKFSFSQVEQLLTTGRWDGGEEGKGDFTAGAGLNRADIVVLQGIFDKDADTENKIAQLDMRLSQSKVGQEGRQELETIVNVCSASGYEADRIRIDPTIVRGLEYYTGAVFEVELLLEARDDKGRPVRFGSVGGGGRYDGLVSRFRGEPVPATGFSIGVSRLQAALELLNKDKPQPVMHGPVVVTVFGGDIADYQKMVAELRAAKIRAELYLGNPKHSLGQQVKYADKRNSPLVITQGTDERAAGTVQINDLIAGAGLSEIADREEYLKRKAASLLSAPRADFVAHVQVLLDKHGVAWG